MAQDYGTGVSKKEEDVAAIEGSRGPVGGGEHHDGDARGSSSDEYVDVEDEAKINKVYQ